MNVALPSLVRQTGATTTDLQWVVDAYNLVFAALVLAAGSLSDRLGRKGILLAGLAVFGASSLAGSFATSAGPLIAARAVMGLGAAMMFPSTLSLLTNAFTARRERAAAIGLWGASMSEVLGGLVFFTWTTNGQGQVGSSFGGRALIIAFRGDVPLCTDPERSATWRAMDCGLSPDHHLQKRRLGSPGTT